MSDNPFPPFDPSTVNTDATWLDDDGNPVDTPPDPEEET